MKKILSLMAICLCLPGAAAPQQREQAQKTAVSLLRIERVKPDMVAEYEDLVKNELAPALKKGGIAAQQAWATAGLGDFYHYIYINPIKGFALLDGPSPAEKALGRDGAQRLTGKLRRAVASVTYLTVAHRPDLSLTREGEAAEPALALMAEYRILPGRRAEFEGLLKNEILPAIRKDVSVTFSAYQVLIGGDPNAYVFLALIKSFAELDKGPFTAQVLGEEAARALSAKLAGVAASVSVAAYRRLPELSYK